MAIYRGNREMTLIYHGNRAISAIYKGVSLVWQGIRSCFGAGFWVAEKPWLDNEAWKYYQS